LVLQTASSPPRTFVAMPISFVCVSDHPARDVLTDELPGRKMVTFETIFSMRLPSAICVRSSHGQTKEALRAWHVRLLCSSGSGYRWRCCRTSNISSILPVRCSER
jgi:hypothetical protein